MTDRADPGGGPTSWSDLSAKQQFDVWLASVLAKAWDEGAKWGAAEVTGDDKYETGAFLAPGDNPYRIGEPGMSERA